jgi:uncharacterized membrane protein YdjX (TVP38/TMEM64 family)
VENEVLQLFKNYPAAAVAISLFISIIIAVLGVVPSVFVTGANLLFFGFWKGLLISFLGEALGAALSFVLYRKGFKKMTGSSLQKFPNVKRLVEAEGKEAFWLVLSLRLIPFVTSGLVTFAAAVGRVSLPTFIISSSLGKIPALLLEAYTVYEVTKFGWPGKIILLLAGLGLLYWMIRYTPFAKRKK